MAVIHSAAGLVVAADRPLPGLEPAAPHTSPEVSVQMGVPAPWHDQAFQTHYVAPHANAAGRPIVTVGRAKAGFHFDYADGTEVWVSSDGATLWCTWPSTATLEDAATYVCGPVLGFVLRLRGFFALHASAVHLGDGALLLVGIHGAGKSTTAAALALQGGAVIADDIVRLTHENGSWRAHPFGGVLRLWPDGARLVFGRDTTLPRITPTWDKRALAIGTRGVAGAADALPIRAVAFLEARQHSASAPRLEELGSAEAVVRFATHSSAAHLLDDRQRAREFAVLGQVTGQVACTRAIASDNESLFPRFVDLLHDWALRRCGSAA